jgi:hypothetical protein
MVKLSLFDSVVIALFVLVILWVTPPVILFLFGVLALYVLLLSVISRYIPFIKTAYVGEEPLWKVFWIFYVGYFIVFDLISSGLARVLTRSLYTDLAILWAIYTWVIVGGISVWRCAFNAKRPEWGYLARAVVFFPSSMAAVSIPFLGFFLFSGY